MTGQISPDILPENRLIVKCLQFLRKCLVIFQVIAMSTEGGLCQVGAKSNLFQNERKYHLAKPDGPQVRTTRLYIIIWNSSVTKYHLCFNEISFWASQGKSRIKICERELFWINLLNVSGGFAPNAASFNLSLKSTSSSTTSLIVLITSSWCHFHHLSTLCWLYFLSLSGDLIHLHFLPYSLDLPYNGSSPVTIRTPLETLESPKI